MFKIYNKNKIIIAMCIIFTLIILMCGNKSFANNEEKPILEDGTYIIRSAMNNKYVLDLNGPSKDNCANISLWQQNGGNHQKYKIEYVGEGFYTIESAYSNKMLDVAWASKENGANVEQYEKNNGDNQKWLLKDAGDGYFYIMSKCNNLYIDIENAKCQNGANSVMWEFNGGNNQKFKFDRVDKKIEPIKSIESGVYTISIKLNSNYVIDIADGSKENCANVALWEKNGGDNQKFRITYLDDGYYKITSISSNKNLDIAWASKENGANVEQYTDNNGDNQKWIIQKTDDGYYNLISKCNNLYLGIDKQKAKAGDNLATWVESDSDNQKFKFEKLEEGTQTIENGTYTIKSMYDEKYVLDLTGPSKTNGANIELWENNGGNNQKFKIEYLANGYYKILSTYSKKSLTVHNNQRENGANVEQYEWNDGANQKWIIKENEDKSYSIISASNNLYIDIAGPVYKNGTNIGMWQYNGGENQKFKFEKVITNIELDETKYPGYKEKIKELQEEHPNWNFEFLYTGLKFSSAVAGEAEVHSRNLVETSHSGEWICSTCGTKLYDSGWYCASEKAIAHYLDPRNFLDEVNIFQFQDVNEYLEEACTLDGIKAKVERSFLQNYAEDIEKACRNTNTNPYYIIARLFQEQGVNGTTIGRGMDGGDGKTYYNPFNIGASGNGGAIYANALKTAKNYGWDTMQKALEGGIGFCKENWLENYQNTLYQNRFDIDSTNGTALYTHQYMQNLMGAYSEAQILQSMYKNTDRIDSSFTFIIPLYEQMDKEAAPLPSETTEAYPINVETTGTYVRVREGASTDSNIIKEIAEKGTILLSIERGVNSDWQKVVLQDGTIGYVSGKYLSQVKDITNCNYTAAVKTNDGNGCNIRLGPSINTTKLTALADGEQVTVIDDSTYKNIGGFDWYRIIIPDGRQAFIPGKYLSKIQKEVKE